jgi:putative lipoprotein (rSAM/lipoprotein system)
MAQYGVVETEYRFKGAVISEKTGELIPGIKLSINDTNDKYYYGNRLESSSDGRFHLFSFMHSDISNLEILAEDVDGELNGGSFKPARTKVLTDNGDFTRDPVRQGSWHHYYDYSDTIKIVMQEEQEVTPYEPEPTPAIDSVTIIASMPEITIEAEPSAQGANGTKTEPVIVHQSALIYPNPTKDIITIELLPVEAQEIRIALYDANNRLLKNTIIPATEGNIRQQMDLGAYSSGTYYLTIEGKSFSASGKIVKN